MSKVVLLGFLVLGNICLADPDDSFFTEVCDVPEKVAPFRGPRLLKAGETKAIEPLILKKNTSYTPRGLQSAIKEMGLFASSPYLNKNRKAYEPFREMCVLFVTGGIPYIVKYVQEDPSSTDSDVETRVRLADKRAFDFLARQYSSKNED